MGKSSNSPRFRIRLEDGAELPINSVEGLARRVARGDLDPETPLYDESTGAWLTASDAPVVRFIVEEMERDGVELPAGWISESTDAPPQDTEARDPALDRQGTPLSGVEEESSESHQETSGREQDLADPLALDLTLAPEPEIAEGETGTGVGDEAPPPAVPVPSQSEPTESDEWMTPRSEGGLFTRTVNEEQHPDEIEVTRRVSRPGSTGASRLWRGSPRERFRRVGLLAGGVLLLGLGLVLGFPDQQDQDARGGSETGSAGAEPELPEVPQGLADAVERSAERIGQRYQAAADSARSEGGLPGFPPEPWLSGYYLANAVEFPEVVEFWSSYQDFVDELRALEPALFQDVLPHALDASGAAPEQVPMLETYLQARYAATVRARQEAYDHLVSVSSTALDLHTFLVESSDALQFTPALGGGSVARDPVLEVGTEDPEVRGELDRRLDELFQALDRSRAGGTPSPAGLQDELFEGFAVF